MTKYIKFIALATTLVLVGLVALSVSAYTPPTFEPPTCPVENPACNPPVNTGSANQRKQGGIITVSDNFSTFMKFVVMSVGRLNSPVRGSHGGSGDRFILGLGADDVFPVSIGLAATHLWNSVPAGLFYAWYVDGIQRVKLTENGLFIGPTNNGLGGTEGGELVLADKENTSGNWSGGNFKIDNSQGILRIFGNGERDVWIGMNGILDIFTNLNVGQGDLYVSDRNNRVGIGTISPSTKLDVNGQIRIRGGAPGAGKVLTSDATGLASWTDGGGSGSGLWEKIGTSNHIKNSNIGNVGIGTGTTNPAYKLDVVGNSRFSSPLSNASLFLTNTGSGGGNFRFIVGQTEDTIPGGFGLYDQKGSAYRLAVTSAGNVGIGLTNPTAKLDVNGQIKISGGSPGEGKVLASNAVGLASWVDPKTLGSGSLTPGGLGYDVTDDGRVNNYDETMVRDCVANKTTCSSASMLRSDLNRDGLVNNTDLQMISNAVAQLGGSSLWGVIGSTNNISNRNSGSVSIGTDDAAENFKLYVGGNALVAGALRIVDGTQAKGKVLMSKDDFGLAEWVATSTLGLGGGSGSDTPIPTGLYGYGRSYKDGLYELCQADEPAECYCEGRVGIWGHPERCFEDYVVAPQVSKQWSVRCADGYSARIMSTEAVQTVSQDSTQGYCTATINDYYNISLSADNPVSCAAYGDRYQASPVGPTYPMRTVWVPGSAEISVNNSLIQTIYSCIAD